MRTIAFATFAFALTLTPALARHAEIETAQDWRKACAAQPWYARETITSQYSAQCRARTLGEVNGVLAGMRLSKAKPFICEPPMTGLEERFTIVQRYIARHPEAWSQDIGEVTAAALADAFPCHGR